MNLQVENPLGLAKQTDKPLAQKVSLRHTCPELTQRLGKYHFVSVDISYPGEIDWHGKKQQ